MTGWIILAFAGACLFALGTTVGSWIPSSGSVLQAAPQSKCGAVPSASALAGFLTTTSSPAIGGLFDGVRMWGAVVNPRLARYAPTRRRPTIPTQVWPGSQAIAQGEGVHGQRVQHRHAGAIDRGAVHLHPARPFAVEPGTVQRLRCSRVAAAGGTTADIGQSGWRPDLLWRRRAALQRDGPIIGGLGVSGDTSCADHEVAKRVRNLADLNPPGEPLRRRTISYSSVDGPSPFTHPLCPGNAFRNATLHRQ